MSFSRSSLALAELLELPIRNRLEGLPALDHFGPGTILLAELDPQSPLSYGLPEKVAVMHVWSPAFEPVATTGAGPKMAAKYPDYDPRLSGFMLGQKYLQGAGAVAVQNVGKGRVIMFAFRPQFRALTYGSSKLLFNAIFWSCRQN